VDEPVGLLENLLRRDRAIAAAGIVTLAVLAWAALVSLHRDMIAAGQSMSGTMADTMVMPSASPWSGAALAALIGMWAVMMVAMMVPAVAPVVLLYAHTMRRRMALREPAVPAAIFLLGYLTAWVGFSVIAGALQWALHAAAAVSPMTMRATPTLAGLLLVGAGLYQWTPLKGACLRHCRSPLHFFSTEWREGSRGAWIMGLRHGSWCVGCCSALMLLLFVAGVMNLAWVALIAAFVLVERVAPAGVLVGRAAGVLLVLWGGWVLVAHYRMLG
jgi:predicted metal-binding membrane protein